MNKISAIVIAKNEEKMIADCLESLSFCDEIVVIDDGSSDNTPSISSIYTQHIKYKRKINGGACSARNEGIRLSVGDFIAFIDCDDYINQRHYL
jgi:glycosyltransferase involved in cell wall biosynthesis